MADQETAKPAIKHRYTDAVLFEGESGMTTRNMLEMAASDGANLRGANLCGADLRGADLRGANLCGADLRGADLGCADLDGADLRGANLGCANLRGKKLAGDRPFFTIGPIGFRNDYLQAFITDAGVMIRAGCFFDTRDQFALAVDAEHGGNEHGQEYRAALALIDKHAELWAEKERVAEAA